MSRQDPARARSVAQLVASINAGARAKFIFFWGHRPQPDGQLGPSCFSQWWPARFSAEGVSFASAEHYMMWRKAQLFGDTSMAAAILAAKSPA